MGNYIFKRTNSENTDVETQTNVIESPANRHVKDLDVNILRVNEIYFKNSQWRVRVHQPGNMDFLYFEHYDSKTKQWKLQYRILQ